MLITDPARRLRTNDDRGSTLVSVLVITLVLGVITAAMSVAVIGTTRTTASVRGSLQAQSAADAGLAAAVAAAKAENVCDASVPAGTLGTGVSYTASIQCNAAKTLATLTAVGAASGASATVTAGFALTAETKTVADPALTPAGLVLYDPTTMGQVTLLASGSNKPQIVSLNGTFGCRLAVPGNLLVKGDITSSDSCNISGDIWASGVIDFSGGAITVLGNITAAGTGLSKINASIGPTSGALTTVRTGGAVDFLWSQARLHADVIAKGNVTVNNRTVDGSVTLPTGSSVSINGGTIKGGTVYSSSIPAPPSPTLPGWYEYKYKASDWPGATVVTLQNAGSGPGTCALFDSWPNQGWKDLAGYTGTVVIDGRACDLLTSNNGGNPSPALKAGNVVLLAKKFNTTSLTMTSAAGASPKVYFITEDTVADGKPTCPLGASAVNFEFNGANLDGVRTSIYTPCALAAQGGGILRGSLYTNAYSSGDNFTIKGELMGLPGQPLPDGGYASGGGSTVQTGRYLLGAELTRRDVTG